MAITLINCSGVSFRSVSKIFLIMNISFDLNLRVPSHVTVLNWVKKQGIANFREKDLGRALTYKDLVPVVLKTSESWKANDVESEIKNCIDID